MDPSNQTGWESDDLPWITNNESFFGIFDNLKGRRVFITWVLGKYSYSLHPTLTIQGIRPVLENMVLLTRTRPSCLL